MTVALAFLAFMRCTHDAVGCLPWQVIVERSTALAVIADCVMPADAFAMYHVTGLLWACFIAPGWHAVISMSVAQAAAFNNEIVDSVVVHWKNSRSRMFGPARALLSLQETNSQVGDRELVLSSQPVGIHRAPR